MSAKKKKLLGLRNAEKSFEVGNLSDFLKSLAKKKFKELDVQILINSAYELDTHAILKLLTTNICSFKDIVDKFEDARDTHMNPRLYEVLYSKRLFKDLNKTCYLTNDDLRYLLNKVRDWRELNALIKNTVLLERILNEFWLLNKSVYTLNAAVNVIYWNSISQKSQYTDIFDYIKAHHKNDNNLLKLLELNQYVYNASLVSCQKKTISEVLRDNEIAQNRLRYIVDNHLENSYDFDSLMMYLKKKEKKNILNI